MAKKKNAYDTTDPAVLKRAVAGAIVQKVEEIITDGDYSNEQLRLLITRFFVDEDLIDDYQQLINEANLKGKTLWDSLPFREQFKADLTTQMNKAIWKLHDSFVILAVLYGDYKPKESKSLDDVPSLNDIFPEMNPED